MNNGRLFSREKIDSNNRKFDELRKCLVFETGVSRATLNEMLSDLLVLDYEDNDLTETTHSISGVVDIVSELYGEKRDAEALTVLISLIWVLCEHYERDRWYSMYDDYNEMDYSPVKKRVEMLLKSLFHSEGIDMESRNGFVKEFEELAEENVLGNYTSWNLKSLADCIK